MPVAKNAPTNELGAQSSGSGTGPGSSVLGWGGFVEDFEYVPEWSWPSSVNTAHVMRSDSQVDSLHLGTTSAVRDMRWSIDPNGAPAAIVERLAEDIGLPIRGHEDDHVPLSAFRFNFDAFLTDALLSPIYGHFYFEQVGELTDDAGNTVTRSGNPSQWHLRKLAPRHPRTLAEIGSARDGGLQYIRQNIGGSSGRGNMWADAPPIPVDRLVAFVWRQESGSWVGRSMLRSMYREWLVKDRTIRVAAINLERAGGVPVIEGPDGASDGQLRELAQMARQFKVSEGGGGAIPFGSKLHLAGANAPNAIDLLRYCDEAMARVWALMLIQLGQTQSGSRALGGEFTSYAGRAQRSLAQWIAYVFTRHVIADYVEWNLGPGQRYAPRLHVEPARPDSASTEELVAMIDAGLITVDPELEAWMRNERGLPIKPEGLPAAGDPALKPDPVPAPVVPVVAAPDPVAARDAARIAAAFDPKQPRDSDGKWGSGIGDADVKLDAVAEGVLVDAHVEPDEAGAQALADYASMKFLAVNAVMRGSAGNVPLNWDKINADKEKYEAIAANLNALIDSQDPLTESVQVYRGVDLDGIDDELGDLAEGSTFTDKGFTSTSLDPLQARYFMGGTDPVLMRLRIPEGTRVYFRNADTAEKEIVLHSGASFKIVQREEGVDVGGKRKATLLDVELLTDPPVVAVAPVAVHAAAVAAMGPAAHSRRLSVRAAAAGRRRAAYVNASLPERELRRQPNEHEIAAAVDFRALDEVHAAVTASAQSLYLQQIIPAQIAALGEQVTNTKAGAPRKRLTRSAMAKLAAPEGGRDELVELLVSAARGGAAQAVAEIAEQGREIAMPADEALRAAVTDQADAVTTMAANGISLSAQRKATALVGGGRSPEDAAAELEAHLAGMAHKWTTDQLQGAVQQAQNAGRFAVFASVGTGVALTAYSSEILDTNTCGPCADEDGTDYPSLADAMLAYASGGFIGCEGGPRCRGMAIVVLDES